jgi:hypothetical protein
MKWVMLTLVVLFLSSYAGLPSPAIAVSWYPLTEEREDKDAKGIMEKGARVCLFQSGTADVRKEIHINDILAVYRQDQDHQMKEVGKIKILYYVGEDYMKGEVVEGEVKAGDIAKKGDVASVVISSSDKCK